MGKGKGSVSRWVCNINPGQILYEVNGVSSVLAFNALKYGSGKLPIKTSIISY